MAEYIDIDAPIDVAVYQRNRRIQVTLRQILESNDAKYEAADVRPVVRGKWIWFGDCSNEGLYCSVCKNKIHEARNPKKKLSNFCPNCGADMREES